MNKQIEDMAREIESAKRDIWASVKTRKEDEDYLWHSRIIAEHLTSLGYQKVDKNKQVVLSKEEYEILLSNADSAFQDGLNESRDLYKQEVKEEVRKETASEILSKLKKKGTIHTEFDWNDYLEIDIDDLKELAKQYGVEVDSE